MNYQESMEYIEKIQVEYASSYTLDAVTELSERMGRPDRKLRIIHIAGTNGKGSVGAYISNALAMSGYRVGRYVSPTLFDYRERIQKISGTEFGVETEWISEEEVTDCISRIKIEIESMVRQNKQHPTAFEIETVMAFYQMVKWHVDVAVIEVGLGGAQDATNIIMKPALTVFSKISLDHTAILGDTIEKIAGQKFGIIKAGIPVVSVRQENSVMEQLRTICQRKGLKLAIAEPEQIRQLEYQIDGTRFVYKGNTFQLSQLGVYQIENAIVALEAMEQLEKTGFHKINISSVQNALKNTKWAGRFELVSMNPFLLIDGAHNPAGAKALRRSLETYFPTEQFTFVFGVFKDKDYQGILQEMLPLAKRVYTVRAAGPRAIEAKELEEIIKCHPLGQELLVKSCNHVAMALEEINRQPKKEKIIIFGSLSFLEEVYQYFLS